MPCQTLSWQTVVDKVGQSLHRPGLNPRPAAVDSAPGPRWWEWPQVLSLEAPLVAVLWMAALAAVHRVWVPPVTGWGLALVVWLIYIADRTIDAWQGRNGGVTTARHAFYARRLPWVTGLVLPGLLIAVGGLGLFGIPAGLLWEVVALGILIVGYALMYVIQGPPVIRDLIFSGGVLVGLRLLSVLPIESGFRASVAVLLVVLLVVVLVRHFRRDGGLMVPKEVTAGALFAIGTVRGVHFFSGGVPLEGALEVVMLGALFALNLLIIAEAEEAEDGRRNPCSAVLKRWQLGAYLTLGLASGWVGSMTGQRAPLMLVGAGTMAGALMLAWVQVSRARLSASQVRSLADVAVAVPPLALLAFG